jgi:long-chain acyl-CoA synthetase
LTGRKTLTINRGGYKTNPFEVEAAIRQIPQVAEVAVLGVPSQHGDEMIGCVICGHGPV